MEVVRLCVCVCVCVCVCGGQEGWQGSKSELMLALPNPGSRFASSPGAQKDGVSVTVRCFRAPLLNRSGVAHGPGGLRW